VRENNLLPAGALDCSHWVPRTYVLGLHSDAPRRGTRTPLRGAAWRPLVSPWSSRRTFNADTPACTRNASALKGFSMTPAFLQKAIRIRPFCERQFGTS